MRIGFLTHQFPGVRSGGIGTYCLQAAAVLADAGHEPHIFTLALPADVRAAVPAGVRVHEVADLATLVAAGSLPGQLAGMVESGGEGIYRLAVAWLLCDAAREFHETAMATGGGGLEILEAPDYEGLALPLLANPHGGGELTGFPVVTQLHLCSAIARVGNLGTVAMQPDSSPADDLIDVLEFAAIALSDGLCAPTRNIADETRRVSGIDRPVTILQHPLRPGPRAAPLPEKGPVLFVGRLEPRKGTDLFPAAFNEFLTRNPEATVRLVGSDTQWGGGSVRERIIAALHPAIAGRVIFTGEKMPAEVAAEFAACRFSICPSLFESYGYVVAESLQAGRPVVVGDGTGAAEIVADTGILFERGNAAALAGTMEKLWRDPNLCRRLADRAKLRGQELASPEKTIGERIEFYRRICSAWAVSQEASRQRSGLPERFERLRPRHAAALFQALAALTGALTGIEGAAAETSGSRLLALMREIASQDHAPAKVLLYGAGRFTARLLAQKHLWEKEGHRVVGLVDDHPRFFGTADYLGLPICSAAALLERARSGESIPPIVLSTDTFQEQFWSQTALLRERGIIVHRL